ncbi:MAG: hypothetical protein R2795_01350 [Saprospiraceae bacterium]
MEALLQWDYQLFHWINHGWQHPWLDALMPVWREKTTWIPLYVVWLGLLVWQFRWKGFYLILFVALAAGVADFTSSELVKNGATPTPL